MKPWVGYRVMGDDIHHRAAASDSSTRALRARLSERVKALVSEPGLPGVKSAVVRIDAPAVGFGFECAAGEARGDTGEAMTPDTVFHLASIAKTMTAVLICQANERQLLGADGLNARLSALGVFDDAIIERLHKINGRSFGDQITLQHLLSHMSGMKDAMVDDGSGVADAAGPRPNSIIGRIFSDAEAYGEKAWRPWDPSKSFDAQAGVLNYYLNTDHISETALFEPGAAFHYSDTGYVLLAIAAEKLFGKPLHQLMRDFIFTPLGMKNTYLAYRDDPALGPNRAPEAEIYAGDAPCLASGKSLSFDWGGGGVVSTARELNAFLIGLSQGALFDDAKTLDQMTSWQTPNGLNPPRLGVGCGLFKTDGKDFELWGHSGAWGGKMFYDPDVGVFFSGSLNQTSAPIDWHLAFIQEIHDALKNELTP